MIPAAFDYTRPSTVDEAVAALADEDAKVLAGGQSLLPLLRLRLTAPTTVVDLGGIADLRGVREDGDDLVIGAMTTHATVLRDPLVAEHAPLLAQATATVADRQVRHRGTFGGALAHADPAGDLPAVAVASEAVFEVAGPNGRRSVPAADFFVDYLTSALEPGEVLVAVRVPKRTGWSSHYEKFHHTAQSWALVGVAALVKRSNGSIAEARVALTNMGPKPVRANAVESALAGAGADKDAVRAAAAHAADGAEPSDDLTGSREYRTHLARVLTERAVLSALG
ncbi:FAD binding domain-containing protein [Virgisporangium aurantiacum]|uniref:Carbon-monoxide dehydrogenase medium subunit n=1 Tax=Virgisporangium aurantiacum TaxID=175570 RepID=A0A8J3ZA66_9ACTN|nr:xanthine dehydrogenase family protein subunit M [Virgisporangium aurantiacum]GIJ58095.1 carbon-monoxide dehydrogenase medium subunit [Virgisporangium aurantiacum]